MFEIAIPGSFFEERKYVINVLFETFLGLNFSIKVTDSPNYSVTYKGDVVLIIEDHFFSHCTNGNYIIQDRIPQPKTYLQVPYFTSEYDFISLYHSPGTENILVKRGNFFICKSDIIAAVFFMLTRWEEACISDRDLHGRVSAKSCLAFRYGFLNRPIVNEYVEFIWSIISQVDQQLKRRSHQFAFMATHDVDEPFEFIYTKGTSLVRQLAGDVFKRWSISVLFKRIRKYSAAKFINISHDPFNTFKKILNLSDEYKVKSYFNFFGGRTSSLYDCKYDISDPKIVDLLCLIYNRGHVIGFHPSYFTSQDGMLLNSQFHNLKDTCYQNGIHQEEWGGRQHYLKWDIMNTANYWDTAAIDFDSSLGYYDMPGFRCGTCYTFPLFDLTNRVTLRVKETPLIAMECSFFDYAGMTYEEAFNYGLNLFQQTKKYNGNFVVLWHNDRLFDERSDSYNLYIAFLNFFSENRPNHTIG